MENAASGQSAKIPRIWTSSAKQLARTVTALASAQSRKVFLRRGGTLMLLHLIRGLADE